MPPVAIGILILVLFNGSTGIINRGLGLIGIPGPFWTTDPDWIKPSLAIMSIWTVGGTMVIYLAALKAVPTRALRGGRDGRRRAVAALLQRDAADDQPGALLHLHRAHDRGPADLHGGLHGLLRRRLDRAPSRPTPR